MALLLKRVTVIPAVFLAASCAAPTHWENSGVPRDLCEEITGKKMNLAYSEESRIGDHIWWISDVRKFRSHYPDWSYRYDLRGILREIHTSLSAKL